MLGLDTRPHHHSANAKCSASGATTTVPACTGNTTKYGYGSWASYASTGASSIKSSIPKLTIKIGSITYTSTTSAAAAYTSCKSSSTVGGEVGFKITGKVTAQSSGTTYKNR